MYNTYKRKTKLIEIIPLLLIPFIGLGGIGFSWYYPSQLQPAESTVKITYQKPMVLGVQAEKDNPIEEMFYQETAQSPKLGSGVSTKILPLEVEDLFFDYCGQEAYQDKLQQWFCSNKDELEDVLTNDSIYTE